MKSNSIMSEKYKEESTGRPAQRLISLILSAAESCGISYTFAACAAPATNESDKMNMNQTKS